MRAQVYLVIVTTLVALYLALQAAALLAVLRLWAGEG